MAFARIARCPLSASDRFEPDHAAQRGGRVLGEPLAVGLGKLVEPRRHDRQGKRPAVRLTGGEQRPRRACAARPASPRRVAGSSSGRSQAARVGVAAQIAFAVEQHGGDVAGEQLFDQMFSAAVVLPLPVPPRKAACRVNSLGSNVTAAGVTLRPRPRTKCVRIGGRRGGRRRAETVGADRTGVVGATGCWDDGRTRDRSKIGSTSESFEASPAPRAAGPPFATRRSRTGAACCSAESLECQHPPPVGVGDDHTSPVPSQHAGDLVDALPVFGKSVVLHDRDGDFAGALFELDQLLAECTPRVLVLHTATSSWSTCCPACASRLPGTSVRGAVEVKAIGQLGRRGVNGVGQHAGPSLPHGRARWPGSRSGSRSRARQARESSMSGRGRPFTPSGSTQWPAVMQRGGAAAGNRGRRGRGNC